MSLPRFDTLSPASRLVDRVKARLRTAIFEGRLAPGSSLSVPELSRQLGVSRSPVREALIHLLAEGLAVETSRRGISVAQKSAEEIAELRELVAWLEVCAVARVARAGPESSLIERLEHSCAAQQAALAAGDASHWGRLNLEFHRLLVARCGSGTLTAQYNLAVNQLRAARADVREAEQPSRGTPEHERLVAALRARDAAAAEAVARLHMGMPGPQ